MSSMVAVGSALDAREEESEPCRVMDLRCSVRLRSARNPGWTPRPALGELGTAAGGSEGSPGVRRVLSFRLGRVGGGAFLAAGLDHGCGCGLTTATLGEAAPRKAAGISMGGGGSSTSGGGGGKSESDGGEGNSPTGSLPRGLGAAALAAAPACARTPGRWTPERFSFPGLGGAAGGGGASLLGDPEGSVGGANLLTRLSTEGLLGSGGAAPPLDFMLELRCGVGGGFFAPGLAVLPAFLPGDPLLSGAGAGAVGVAGGGGVGGGGGGGGGGNTRLLSGGGGGKSGEGAGTGLGCHLGLAFTAGGDCGATCAGTVFEGCGSAGAGGGGNWLAIAFTTESPGDGGAGGGFPPKLWCLGSVGGGTGPGGAAGEGGMWGKAGFFAGGTGGRGVGGTACVTTGGAVLVLVGGRVTSGLGGAWGEAGGGGGGVGGAA